MPKAGTVVTSTASAAAAAFGSPRSVRLRQSSTPMAAMMPIVASRA